MGLADRFFLFLMCIITQRDRGKQVMEFPWIASALILSGTITLFVLGLYNAKKIKNMEAKKIRYAMVGGVCFPLFLASVAFALNIFSLLLLSMVVSLIGSVMIKVHPSIRNQS